MLGASKTVCIIAIENYTMSYVPVISSSLIRLLHQGRAETATLIQPPQGSFYENIDRDCPTNPTSTGFLVEGSVPLGFLGHSYSSLGIKLPLELTGQKFLNSYISLTTLRTENKRSGRSIVWSGDVCIAFHGAYSPTRGTDISST
jgi:hypothetical protein